MAPKDCFVDEPLESAEEGHADAPLVPEDKRTEGEWAAELARRARRAIAGEPGIPWSDARRMLEQRFGSF